MAVSVLILWSRKPEMGPWAVSRPISAVLGTAPPARSAESLQVLTSCSSRSGSGGAFARASILRRALTNSSYEGCPRPRRMVSPLACRTTRPARLMTPKRTAFNRLLTHSLPNTNRFTAEFRLNANTVIAHHAALAPNSPDGSLPPAKSSFSTACTSSPLPHLCLYHHTNSSPGRPRLVTTPAILYQPPSPICIVGTDNSS